MQCDTCVAFAQIRNMCYICRTDQSLGYAIDSSFVHKFYVSNDYLEQGKLFVVYLLLKCNFHLKLLVHELKFVGLT